MTTASEFADWLRTLGCRSPLRATLVAIARERLPVDVVGAGGEAVLVSASLADAEMVVDEALAELARDGLAHPDEAGDHRWRIGPWGWREPSYDVAPQKLDPGEIARVLARYPKRTQPRSDPERHVEDRRGWLRREIEQRFAGLLPIDADSLANARPCRCDACSDDVVVAEAARESERSLPGLEQEARDEAELAARMLLDIGGPPAMVQRRAKLNERALEWAQAREDGSDA